MVATRGWQGNPPADDDDARARIVASAVRCVHRFGANRTTLADVATDLGVTRQTVYRLFPSTEALLVAAGRVVADDFVELLRAHVKHIEDPVELVVEALAFTIEHLREHTYLGLFLADAGPRQRGVTSPYSRAFGANILRTSAVAWDEPLLEDLAEFMLRIVTSFLVDPGRPPRSSVQLRTFLREFLGPAVARVAVGIKAEALQADRSVVDH